MYVISQRVCEQVGQKTYRANDAVGWKAAEGVHFAFRTASSHVCLKERRRMDEENSLSSFTNHVINHEDKGV